MNFEFSFSYEIDHIGIAVESLDEGQKIYKALGLTVASVEEVVTEKVRVAMIPVKNQANIELLEPLSEDSPIAIFLKKRGPGVHHLCLRVDDIKPVVQKLKQSGVRLINEEPRPGAHGTQVVFIHPKSAGGVLLEISQPRSS
ncbi:MAG: methylmalonyl-CoA epimerase [Bdellovibrionales bacterium]|nr:methylmalonyl-CoA epimerase [Bdellovibrionales bacterium]